MKYSHRLSDAVHILTYLEIYHGQKISSQDLAASVDANPSLKSMYAAGDGNTAVFYLKNATAEICSFTAEPEVIRF